MRRRRRLHARDETSGWTEKVISNEMKKKTGFVDTAKDGDADASDVTTAFLCFVDFSARAHGLDTDQHDNNYFLRN